MGNKSKCLIVLIIYGLFTASSAIGSEEISVKGINGCNRAFYPEIGSAKASLGIFLVTGLRIEYNGEKSVSIDPSYFQLKLGGRGYNNAAATYYLDQKGLLPLPALTLYKGGSIEGYIAYDVPVNEKDGSFEIVYTGWEDVKMNPFNCS